MRQKDFAALKVRLFLTAVLGGLILAMTACGGGMPGSQGIPAVLQGSVHGGQPAVQGATIQLYAASTSGYGAPATPLLTKTVKTNGFGSFTITGDYSCPSGDAQVYIVATGGNPGLAMGTDNSALAMMAAIGRCDSLTTSTWIDINEVSTVAAVWALAPFMAVGEGGSLGTSSTNTQGLANAFLTATNLLVDTSKGKGTSPGPSVPAGATVPSDEIYTLADILSGCINSDSPASSGCSSLFSDSAFGGTTPSNTIDAALLIAQHPDNNAAALFGLVPTTPPFGQLGSAPNDWTVAITYTDGGLNNPTGVAVDGSGNVWVANSSASTAVEYSPLGVLLSGTGYNPSSQVNFPWGIAVDSSGNAWLANTGASNTVGITSTGGLVAGTPYTGGGLNGPYAIAIDGSGNVWLSNADGGPDNDGSVSEFSSGGIALSPDPNGFFGGGLQDGLPLYYSIAVDHSGNAWTSDYSGGAVTKLLSDGTADASSPFTGGGLSGGFPLGIAIGASGTVWTANGNASLSQLDSNGGAISGGTGYTGGGLNSPYGIAIDGLGNAWAANGGGNSISKFSSAGSRISPDTIGYGSSAGMNLAFGIAIDGSGNIWVTSYSGNTLTEFVGFAAPTVTPLATAAANDTFGTLP